MESTEFILFLVLAGCLFVALSVLLGLILRSLYWMISTGVRKLAGRRREEPPPPLGFKRRGRRGGLGWSLAGGVILFVLPPNLKMFRSPSPEVQVLATGHVIHAALVKYASERDDHSYPPAAAIHEYASLRGLVKRLGWSLPATEQGAGLRFGRYEAHDTHHDGVIDDYLLLLVPVQNPAVTVRLTPSGIETLSAP